MVGQEQDRISIKIVKMTRYCHDIAVEQNWSGVERGGAGWSGVEWGGAR